jgi:hypothetical protein
MPAMLGQAGVTASRAAHKPLDPDVGWVHTVVDMTMPPANAREVRRENDDELLGLLLPAGDQRWWPAAVFGAALGPAADAATAEALVRECGLPSLADRWWVRVGGGSWRPAWLLEVKPDRIRLRWDDPMLMAPGHGEWFRLHEIEIQRQRPAR